MNKQKLKELESIFQYLYPNMFENEDLKIISKKHNMQRHLKNAQIVLAKENFKNKDSIDDIVKIVTRSSLVSVFEKMRFRDLIKEFDLSEKETLKIGVYELVHGDEEYGFNMLVSLLAPFKLAKWPIITIFNVYYKPTYDVFMKPTVVKKVIRALELDDLQYTPRPNFELYRKYRDYLNEMKTLVDPGLSPNNPAFSGFLMITIQD